MVNCKIDYCLDGVSGHVERMAPTSIDGLLEWLATIPQTSKVKALVRVLVPAEIAQ